MVTDLSLHPVPVVVIAPRSREYDTGRWIFSPGRVVSRADDWIVLRAMVLQLVDVGCFRVQGGGA